MNMKIEFEGTKGKIYHQRSKWELRMKRVWCYEKKLVAEIRRKL